MGETVTLIDQPAADETRTPEIAKKGRRPWRPGLLTWLVALLVLVALGMVLYPKASSWQSQYIQSKLLNSYTVEVGDAEPSADVQLKQAYDYNSALSAGAVLEANSNKPTGEGAESGVFDYGKILAVDNSGLMARVKIPGISVDLPIYHGTSDETLLRGAGHLEGSSLPVGGESTHSVITAHRGLATSTMFTNLDKVVEGDRFTIEVFGEVLTYEIRESIVVAPDDTATLATVEGKDLVTLVTCTPLGINSHRILVTGERVTPTPIKDVQDAGKEPTIPGFPWWAVILGGGVTAVGVFVWRAGYSDARVREARAARKAA
jgi:sortase A